jgi:hypothetical protein
LRQTLSSAVAVSEGSSERQLYERQSEERQGGSAFHVVSLSEGSWTEVAFAQGGSNSSATSVSRSEGSWSEVAFFTARADNVEVSSSSNLAAAREET